jgi:hypothetical protein
LAEVEWPGDRVGAALLRSGDGVLGGFPVGVIADGDLRFLVGEGQRGGLADG